MYIYLKLIFLIYDINNVLKAGLQIYTGQIGRGIWEMLLFMCMIHQSIKQTHFSIERLYFKMNPSEKNISILIKIHNHRQYLN